MNGVFENELPDSKAFALNGILCKLGLLLEEARAFRERFDEVAETYLEAVELMRVNQDRAQEILEQHQSRIDELNNQQPPELDEVDYYPLNNVPAGTKVKDLPSGERLFTLSNGLILRTEDDYSFTAVLPSGDMKNVIPGPSTSLKITDGMELEVHEDFLKRPQAREGIEGLPEDTIPVAAGENRLKVELPSGARLDILKDEGKLNVLLPDGTLLTGNSEKLTVSGDTIVTHILSDGTGFLLEKSGMGGVLYSDGSVEIALPDGIDLKFSLFPSGASSPSNEDVACDGLTCEARD